MVSGQPKTPHTYAGFKSTVFDILKSFLDQTVSAFHLEFQDFICSNKGSERR